VGGQKWTSDRTHLITVGMTGFNDNGRAHLRTDGNGVLLRRQSPRPRGCHSPRKHLLPAFRGGRVLVSAPPPCVIGPPPGAAWPIANAFRSGAGCAAAVAFSVGAGLREREERVYARAFVCWACCCRVRCCSRVLPLRHRPWPVATTAAARCRRRHHVSPRPRSLRPALLAPPGAPPG
jgi:hypothetical protein